MSTRKQLVVAFVALMVLCSGVAMVAGAAVASPTTVSAQDDSNDDDEPDDTDTDEDDDAVAEPAASVTFSDQTTDGTTVVVDEVTMDEGGFVTIHDSSLLVGNVIESVIGVSEYLEAGTHENVEIELDEPLEESETLIAMPHLDTNDNQEYDFVETEGEEDGPYVDEDGEPVTDDAVVTLEEDEAPEEDEPEEDEPEVDEPEEEEPEDDETVIMEPDHDAVEDGVAIVQPQATFVIIENLTIEELVIENAEVYVLVIGDDADLDRLEEILDGEVDVDEPEEDEPEEDEPEEDEPEEDEPEEDEPEEDEPEEDEPEEDEPEEDEPEEDEPEEDEPEEDEPEEDEPEEDEPEEDEPEEDEPEEDEPEEDEPEEDEPEEDEPEEDEPEEDVEETESFTVDDLEAPENATVGDVITVTATITNPTDEEATQDVQFRLEGNLVESQSLTLGPEESETVTFEVDTADIEPGEYVHMVLTDEFGQVAFITLEAAEDEEADDDMDENDNGEADRLVPIGALSPL
nr:CARDB domain-containing protein [Natronosalvus amylolyticus]